MEHKELVKYFSDVREQSNSLLEFKSKIQEIFPDIDSDLIDIVWCMFDLLNS
jgi:hypothetical protein